MIDGDGEVCELELLSVGCNLSAWMYAHQCAGHHASQDHCAIRTYVSAFVIFRPQLS